MSFFRTAGNLSYTNALIMKYLAVGIYKKYTVKDDMERRRQAIKYVGQDAAKVLKRCNVGLSFHYSKPDLFSEGKNYLMVCNHMSYMDIIVLSSGQPSVFVTSIEMRDTPFLGDLAAFGGSYFVERRDRSKVPGEVKALANLLEKGFNVFVFPEATSTHGMTIKPFKRAMFKAAIEAGAEILPICLRYDEIDGEPFSWENHKKVCWYDDMTFGPHYLQMMGLKSLKASIHYLEPISTKKFPDRHKLADLAYEQISHKYFEGREGVLKVPQG